MRMRTLVTVATATVAGTAGVAVLAHETAFQSPSQPRARLAAQQGTIPVALHRETRIEANASLPRRTLETMRLDPASVRLVGSFPGVAVTPLRLYTARTVDGHTCLVEDGIDGLTPDGRPLRVSGGACSADLFLGRSVAWIRGTSRGAGGVATLRIIGLVKPGIERLAVASAAGNRTDVPLTAAGAFVWFQPSGSSRPATLVSEAGDGAIVERVALP